MAYLSNGKRIPEFFKVHVPGQGSERLLIPDSFVTSCNGRLPKNAVLSNYIGSSWHVILDCIDGRVCFLNGWQKFFKDNSIEYGDFLIFRYDGHRGFSFKILGKSGCEKLESSAKGTSYMNEVKLEGGEEEKEKEEETKENDNEDYDYHDHDGDDSNGDNNDDDSDYIDEEEENSTKAEAIKKSRAWKQSGGSIGGSKTRAAVNVEEGSKQINVVNIEEEEEEEKSTIRKSRVRKRKQSGGNNGGSKKWIAVKSPKRSGENTGGYKKRVVVRIEEEEEESRDWENSDENNGVSGKMHADKIGRDSKRTNDFLLEEVDVSKYIQPRNPHFIAKLRAGPKRNILPIPSKIINFWQLKLPNMVLFQNKHGRQWRGNVFSWKDGRFWISGWNDFCLGNRVNIHVICFSTNHPLLTLSTISHYKFSFSSSTQHLCKTPHKKTYKQINIMATASATLSPATFMAAAATATKVRKTMKVNPNISGLNSFGGLKAENGVTSLGVPVCTEQSFAKIVSSLRAPSSKGRRNGGGGALSSTCNAADEIFKIAAIMNALTLVGVAVGFVLLRIEASIEEAE
ncbi:hypothetical protein LWI28_015392 [Acer negundo]|uniref:TF-B3 domain-containing protein n=1 Tax=Acer negundo TaxID=4023 RepID=A0AAD5IZV1_ACENE|nr:hypothetical protein LWI28_015392 [Acer negundo]